jgi:type II secretory pathway component PulC
MRSFGLVGAFVGVVPQLLWAQPVRSTIPRADLNHFLDGSPGAFLQQVAPEAIFKDGRFYGWKLTRFFPGDARFAAIDLRAGDVVRRVNGNTLERPEQLITVWQSLRTASFLQVDVERGTVARTLRWAIASK